MKLKTLLMLTAFFFAGASSMETHPSQIKERTRVPQKPKVQERHDEEGKERSTAKAPARKAPATKYIGPYTRAQCFMLARLVPNFGSQPRIHDRKKRERTLLMWAVIKNDSQLAHLILENPSFTGIDLTDPYGETALAEAAYRGLDDMTKLLIAHHATVDSRNKRKYTPFMEATEEEKLRVMASLLMGGAAIDARNDEDETPLICSVQCRFPRVTQFLLAHRANPLLEDESGENALVIAKGLKKSKTTNKIIAMLEAATKQQEEIAKANVERQLKEEEEQQAQKKAKKKTKAQRQKLKKQAVREEKAKKEAAEKEQEKEAQAKKTAIDKSVKAYFNAGKRIAQASIALQHLPIDTDLAQKLIKCSQRLGRDILKLSSLLKKMRSINQGASDEKKIMMMMMMNTKPMMKMEKKQKNNFSINVNGVL